MFNTKVEITTTELNKWRLHHKVRAKHNSRRNLMTCLKPIFSQTYNLKHKIP